YRRGKGWTWHATWTEHGKPRQHKRAARTRKEAEEALRRFLRSVDLGQVVVPDKMTVAPYLADWAEHLEVVVQRKATTVAGYRQIINGSLVPACGDVRLSRLSSAALDRLYRDMTAKGLSARTVRYCHSVIRKALADAERSELVERNVALRANP